MIQKQGWRLILSLFEVLRTEDAGAGFLIEQQ